MNYLCVDGEEMTRNQCEDCVDGGFKRSRLSMLLKHQETAIRALVRSCIKNNNNVIYAEEMGTGKTVTMMAFLAISRVRTKRQTLIVVPASLIDIVWTRHLAEWTDCKVFVVRSAKDARFIRKDDDVVIMSYQILNNCFKNSCDQTFTDVYCDGKWTSKRDPLVKKRDCPVLDRPWGLVIFEEAHVSLGKHGVTAVQHFSDTVMRVAVTGTPFLDPGPGIAKYCKILELSHLYAVNWGTNTINLEAVESFRGEHIIRQEIDQGLPPCEVRKVPYKLDSHTIKTYNELLGDAKTAARIAEANPQSREARAHVLAMFNALLQCLNHPGFVDDDKSEETIDAIAKNPSCKMKAMHKIMRRHVERGEPVVLGHFKTRLLRAMRKYCSDISRSEIFMGSQTATERMESLDSFMVDEEVKTLFLSVMSGGMGITLAPKARVMMMTQQWFNPAAFKQFFARAARKGQVDKVFCYIFYAKNTIEDHIEALVVDREHACHKLILLGDKDWLNPEDRGNPAPTWRKVATLIEQCKPLELDDAEHDGGEYEARGSGGDEDARAERSGGSDEDEDARAERSGGSDEDEDARSERSTSSGMSTSSEEDDSVASPPSRRSIDTALKRRRTVIDESDDEALSTDCKVRRT